MRGPVAPKDPVEKRPCLYVILDKTISGRQEDDGANHEHIYMDGRLINQVKFTSGDVSEDILNLLKDVKGFRKLVHSVGISIRSEEESARELNADFTIICYGKSSKYTTGSRMEMTVPCSGAEMVMEIGGFPINEEDTVIGEFGVVVPVENQNMVITVKFYLNDGYEVPEIEVDPPVQFDSPAYQNMISNSMISTGNNSRLKKVIEKAKAGEDVTIGFIGGSITQGAGAKPINRNCYSYKIYEGFAKNYSPCDGKNIHYVKAGIGGTPSELGMLRYERDVLKDGAITPDLVIIEFAVNDEGDETEGVSFECLTKRILEAKNNPAVILLFAVFMDDYNLQERLIPIGKQYELPMVSVKNAVSPQFYQDTVITKRQYFYDVYHPANQGHRIMADCVLHLMNMVDTQPMAASDINLDVAPVYGTQFTHTTLFDRSNANLYAKINQTGFDQRDTELQCVERDMDLVATPQFTENWMTIGGEEVKFDMTINCKNLLIIMKDSGEPTFGAADIYVDDKRTMTIDPKTVGWNHCHAIILIDDDAVKERKVSIKMHKGDENKKFTILGFAATL